MNFQLLRLYYDREKINNYSSESCALLKTPHIHTKRKQGHRKINVNKQYMCFYPYPIHYLLFLIHYYYFLFYLHYKHFWTFTIIIKLIKLFKILLSTAATDIVPFFFPHYTGFTGYMYRRSRVPNHKPIILLKNRKRN